MGPPDCLSLPYDHSGAFQCEEYVHDGGVYLTVGPMALQRNKLGAGDIAVVNARAQGIPVGPVFPNALVPAPPGTASAADFNSLTPSLSIGVRGTIGYAWDSQSVEVQSFYIFQNNASFFNSVPGALDTLFYNPPLAFLGDGLFRRADQINLTYGSSLLSTEANYRRWSAGLAGLEMFVGVRYLRQNDALDIITTGRSFDDNGFGMHPGRNQATYEVLTHNNIGLGQIGAEYSLPVFKWLSFSGEGKAGWGANYLLTDVSLTRGDGLTAFDTHRHATVFSQAYQLALYADFHLLSSDRLRLRLGYTSLWLAGIASAQDQVDFNLLGFQARQLALQNQTFGTSFLTNVNNAQQAIPHGHINNSGSAIYFGPLAELQFFF
jgi:hypothetical protein